MEVARLPVAVDPGFDLGLAAPDHLYGCMTEGILMTLNADLPPSLGREISQRKKFNYIKRAGTIPHPPAYACGKELLP